MRNISKHILKIFVMFFSLKTRTIASVIQPVLETKYRVSSRCSLASRAESLVTSRPATGDTLSVPVVPLPPPRETLTVRIALLHYKILSENIIFPVFSRRGVSGVVVIAHGRADVLWRYIRLPPVFVVASKYRLRRGVEWSGQVVDESPDTVVARPRLRAVIIPRAGVGGGGSGGAMGGRVGEEIVGNRYLEWSAVEEVKNNTILDGKIAAKGSMFIKCCHAFKFGDQVIFDNMGLSFNEKILIFKAKDFNIC